MEDVLVRKEALAMLTRLRLEMKGEPVSELDAAYRRGWRDCIRRLREYITDDGGPR